MLCSHQTRLDAYSYRAARKPIRLLLLNYSKIGLFCHHAVDMCMARYSENSRGIPDEHPPASRCYELRHDGV